VGIRVNCYPLKDRKKTVKKHITKGVELSAYLNMKSYNKKIGLGFSS
jgi:hypothetical protein